jgi:transcriptional regulator with XRE-family HTH domain
MKLHEKIKFIRQLKGWSQEEIANKLEISVNG